MLVKKPRILVLYYTQSGQLRDILDSIISGIKQDILVDFEMIKPVTPFPFPWKAHSFFDAMPESVLHQPTPVQPIHPDLFTKDYDLIIFGYQPWFLNPSQPITAFLQSDDAKIFKDKPVLTVIGSRNMWLHAQEKVKDYLQQQQAKLVGNIVLFDTNTNIISTLTVIRWAFSGKKEATKFLPEAGVQSIDIKNAARFGNTILHALTNNGLEHLYENLLLQKAVELNPGLVLLEQRGIKNFRFWAKYIREKGGPGDMNRKGRIDLFKRLLLLGIFVLSPISAFSALIKQQLKKKQLSEDVKYFKGLAYEKNRI